MMYVALLQGNFGILEILGGVKEIFGGGGRKPLTYQLFSISLAPSPKFLYAPPNFLNNYFILYESDF